MLREITIDDLQLPEGTVFLKDCALLTAEELFHGVTILSEAPAPRPQIKKEIVRQSRQPWKDAEQAILREWKGGDRTIEEIIERTGYSYEVVTKVIPPDEEDI